MARSKTSNFFVWVILGLLFFGLIGFGASGLSGNIRTIGTVGDKEIGLQEYAQQLQQEIGAFEAQIGIPVSFPQAQAFGLDRVALQRIVAARALDNEASVIGLSIGDDPVRERVLEIPAFRGTTGAFDRDAYRYSLDQNGLTEAGFETSIREEITRTILQGAVVSGVTAPAPYAEALAAYIGESRDFSWIRMDLSNLETPLPTPTDAQLTEYYQGNTPDFTDPEKRRITFAWITPDMIVDSIEIDQELIQEAYDLDLANYVQPERRLVERLIYPSIEDAEAAKLRLENGEVDFDALVEERGLRLADVDLGDVAQSDLGASGPAVFNAEPLITVGPFETDLGPALFRVNAVLAAREQTFDDVRFEIQLQLASDQARRLIVTMESEIDDLLVGGATLEEVAAETELTLGTIDWYDGFGEEIAAYDAFSSAARTLEMGDFPEALELDDGGLFAMRLEEIIEPALSDIETVMPKVIAGWEAQQTSTQLTAQADEIIAQLGVGRDIASFNLEVTEETGMGRNDFIAGAPGEMLETVFGLDIGETRLIEEFGAVFVLQLDAVSAAPDDDPEVTARIELLDTQAQQGIAQDILAIYTQVIQLEAGLELDQAALNAVHAQFQSGGTAGHGN